MRLGSVPKLNAGINQPTSLDRGGGFTDSATHPTGGQAPAPVIEAAGA
jgi:hypothetical protein